MATAQVTVPKRVWEPVRPVTVWATLGLGFVLLAVWTFASWIISGDAKPLSPTGPDRLPDDVRVGMWVIEGLAVALTVLIAAKLIRDCWRQRHLTVDALIGVGILSQFWLDQSFTFIRPGVLFNSYLVNVASWAPHIPGQVGPVGRTGEPLLLFGPCDLAFILDIFLVGSILGWVVRTRPRTGRFGLILVATVAAFAIDLVEELIFIHFQLYVYPATTPQLSLFAGTLYQYPVYSAAIGGVGFIGGAALLRFFRDASGRTMIERGVDDPRVPGKLRPVLRALAFAAFMNLIVVLYAAVMNLGALHSGPTPAGIPSYLRNDVCGAGTSISCPGPGVAIPVAR